jgi:hypothetical protein
LRIPDSVQDAFAHTFERAIGAPQVGQFCGQRVLRVHVFAAAALENQLHLDLVACPLLEVNNGRAGTQIGSGVFAGDRVNRIGPQLAAASRLRHGVENLFPHLDLVGANRRLHLEGRHASVLADGAFTLLGEVDVLGDDRERLARLRRRRLLRHRRFHRRRTSGGRSVEVFTTSDTTLSKN